MFTLFKSLNFAVSILFYFMAISFLFFNFLFLTFTIFSRDLSTWAITLLVIVLVYYLFESISYPVP